MPIVVRTEKNKLWLSWLEENLPILPLDNWFVAASFIQHMISNPAKLEPYRSNLLLSWHLWKIKLKAHMEKWLLSAAGQQLISMTSIEKSVESENKARTDAKEEKAGTAVPAAPASPTAQSSIVNP